MPLRVLKQLGYEAVFDNFDAPGVIQRFDNNDLLPQVFTIGLKKGNAKQTEFKDSR